MSIENTIKLYGMTHHMVERELDSIEKQFDLDLGRLTINSSEVEEIYYPQFQEQIRKSAQSMSQHYELFFCLENSIRSLVSAKMVSKFGPEWWDKGVPDDVKKNVDFSMQRELESGVTPRSTEEIDYTTFGELSKIVTAQWEIFDDTFNNKKGFNRIMHTLNVLRGPIAHCTAIQEDEVLRLHLMVRDWFRLMS